MATGGTFPHPTGNTEPHEPNAESVIGYNFPYRGQQQHGVGVEAQPWIPQDGDAEAWETREDYEASDTEVRPVPVRIVTDTSGEIREWRAAQNIADGAPRLISGRNTAQSSVHVTNTNAVETVWIGPDVTVGTLSGWPLLPGEDVTINTTEPVYAITNGSTVNVAVLIQHSVSS